MTTTPTWRIYNHVCDGVLRAILESSKVLLDAPDREVGPNEIGLDDADQQLSILAKAWGVVAPGDGTGFTDYALAYWRGDRGLDDIITEVTSAAQT